MRECKLLMVTDGNNNKYYNMKDNGSTISIEYGRVGVTKSTASYPSSKWDSIVREKTKKGYKDVTHLFQVEDKEIVKFVDIEDSIIANLISSLQMYTKKNVSMHYNVGAESVTKKQCDEAQLIIDELVKLSSVDSINKVLLNLYTIIPRKMNNVKNYLLTSFEENSFKMLIGKEQDLLDNMASQVTQVELQNNNEDNNLTILDALGLKLGKTSQQEDEIIKAKMTDIKDMFNSAYTVENIKTRNRFNDYMKTVKDSKCELMFHGSRNENWMSILENGLLIRPSNAVYSGSMFGDGIYGANKARKSLGYTSLRGSYWAKGSSNEAYMALYNFHLGKQYIIENSDYSLSANKLKQLGNYDSTYGKAGRSLINDEFIVYNIAQTDIRYLIKLNG